jgi:hypothetical protein
MPKGIQNKETFQQHYGTESCQLIKKHIHPSLEFKPFDTAILTLSGVDAMRMIK